MKFLVITPGAGLEPARGLTPAAFSLLEIAGRRPTRLGDPGKIIFG